MKKSFVIYRLKDKDVPKLFLLMDSLNIDIYDAFKKDMHMGGYTGVCYNLDDEPLSVRRVAHDYIASSTFDSYRNLDDFVSKVFDNTGRGC